MPSISKVSYWIVALLGAAVWGIAILALTSVPLVTQLALASMGLAAAAWGHSVRFPRETNPAREDAAKPLPAGTARITVARRAASSLPPAGELPPLLRQPLEEAARMEAHRLAEALTACGLFGTVSIRLEADGTAFIAPVRMQEGVRVPIDQLVRFASYATQPEGLVAGGQHGHGQWPGAHLVSAIEAHLATIAPHQPPAPRQDRTVAVASAQAANASILPRMAG